MWVSLNTFYKEKQKKMDQEVSVQCKNTVAGLIIFRVKKTLPHAASSLSRAPVSSQSQPRTAPRLSWAWVGRQKRWPPGTWGIQRRQLSVKFRESLTSNHCQQQQMKRPIIQSLAWQRDRDAEWKSNIEGRFRDFWQPCSDPLIIYAK